MSNYRIMKYWKTTCVLAIVIIALVSASLAEEEDGKKKEKKPVTKLQIGVKKRVEDCKVRSRKGDSLQMHYTVCKYKLVEKPNVFRIKL